MKFNKKIRRKILGLLPEKLRFEIMRKKSQINQSWPSPYFEIKIADSKEELASAYTLLHNSYVQSGFMNPDPTGMRVLFQHLLPQTTTIVAKMDSKVIGTLSLIRDNSFGLPLEKVFHVEDRRIGGRRLAEVSSLTLDPKFRGLGDKALLPLIRFVVQYARHYFGIHEFVITVNPSMVDFYLGFMCFERLKAKPIPYDFVKGAPAVGLYLNFETIDERWKKAFEHRELSANYYRYWTNIPTDPQNKLPKRNYHSVTDPIITPKLLSEFFLDEAEIASKLTRHDIQILMRAYPFPEFQNVLRPLLRNVTRKNIRLVANMKAIFKQNNIPAEVYNVAREGLLIRCQSLKLARGDQHYINVWLNDSISTRLKIEVRNSQDNCLFGLKILETSEEWQNMIEFLEQRHKGISLSLKQVA